MTEYQISLLQNYPNQKFDTTFVSSNKNATIKIYQVQEYTYCDIYIDNVLCLAGYCMHDRVKINLKRWTLSDEYLYFVDLQGTTDPDFKQYNIRYLLVYGF